LGIRAASNATHLFATRGREELAAP
jgi:hypothetical protein